MGQLVYLQNNRPVTDSLTVAEKFGKEHRRVMQDIRELDCSDGFRQHHFVQSSYVNEQNREMPKYLIDQDGFAFLVMGYTGKDASRFKEQYIAEFNRLREESTTPTDLEKFLYNPDTILKIAQNWKDELTLRIAAENKLDSQRPLVAFAETCMDSDRNMLVREVAKLASKDGIMIGEKRLYDKLRSWGMVFQQRTEPTQRAMEMGLFEVIKGVRQTPKGARDWETSKVTPKGQMYIVDRLRKEQQAQGA